jgi:hypothetical protein
MDNGVVIRGEYEGNAESKKAIIFSHGFGVKRDSHGMFVELGNILKDNYLVVRFDYVIVNEQENWTKVLPFSAQVNMLKKVYEWLNNNFAIRETSIISHSMGCVVSGLAKINGVSKNLLLAGPPLPPYARLKKYFSQRPETNINESGTSKLKRSDGSITYVPKAFWVELKSLNPFRNYKNLAETSEVTFVRASQDQVITDTDYSELENAENIAVIKIRGNHDFENEARKDLRKIIKDLFLIK